MKKLNIRNFSIISHINHGKSTLSDRFLELTGTVPKDKMKPQYLDMMDLERERGITIRMQPVRMEWQEGNERFILNLVDTPGHVDFSYEVSRSLAATEGAILLVDATQGIQAQTLANLELARKQGLTIIPVVNKIDLEQSRVEETAEEMANLLNVKKEEIIKISAKTGFNVDLLLKEIIKKIPEPQQEKDKPLKALIFDSEYNPYKGVIAYVRIIEGNIKKGEKISLLAAGIETEAKEIGYFKPELFPTDSLFAGEIGYIATGIKEISKVRVGDTISQKGVKVEPLPGYQEPQPMIFASLYPVNPDDFDFLKKGLLQLRLNDPSLTFEPETKEALGRGFKCGFLGSLHIEIVSERLHREFGLDLIISTPSVIYKIVDNKGKERDFYGASDWPESISNIVIKEPWALLEIITPIRYIGRILDLLKTTRSNYLETTYISQERVVLNYEIALSEIIDNLYDKIKNVSQGYASMDYKVMEFREADLVKMDILIAGKKESAFSKIVSKSKIYEEGRKLVEKIKENLPPQQFAVPIQAAVSGKVIARETVKARRKDVTAPLYGGDVTRKKKLLEKQKRGKKELAKKGKVRIPSKVFLSVFRS